MLAIGVAAVFAIGAGAAQAQTKMQPSRGAAAQTQAGDAAMKPNQADQAFLKEAIQGDLAEAMMGELAQQKGESDGVKNFGEMLEKDHGEHLTKLQAMARQMGVEAPAEPSAKQKADHDKMAKMSGAQFDRAFAMHMVDDHKKDITKYQVQAKKSGPLADLAKETVPVLQKHLQMAQSLSKPAPTTGSGGKKN